MNKSVFRLFFKPLNIVNKILGKDENLVFFYANLGFRDNVRALYEYMIHEGYNEKYKIVLSVGDPENIGELPNNVTLVNTKMGIKYFLKAKYAFYCFGKYPIKPAPSQAVVNLWHGIPLKKLGNMEKGCENIDYNFFTHLVTCSEYYRGIMKRCFNCSDNQIMIAGQPRCDRLFFDLPQVDEKIRKGAKKLFVWFPTYRFTEEMKERTAGKDADVNKDESDITWPLPLLTRGDMQQLDEKLGVAGNRMIIKLHPLQAYEPEEGEKENYKNIEIYQESDMKDLGVNIYDMSRAADALITDYSSIYFDYLLLNRPMAFTVDDMEKYGRERGFLLEPPRDYMPGQLINNSEEFNKFIDDVSLGMDKFAGDRARVNDLINTYKDGNNCKRILKKVGICK